MIERLVAALEQARPDLTAKDIAEILWLTLQQWQSAQVPPAHLPTSQSETTSPDSPPLHDQSPPSPPDDFAIPTHG